MSKLFFYAVLCLAYCAWTINAEEQQQQQIHDIMEKHDDDHNKTEEEQADFDQEVLFGGEEDAKSIENLDEHEQQEKLKNFINEKMDVNKDSVVDKDELVTYTKNSIKEIQARELNEEFTYLDTNQDKELTWDEYAKAMYGDFETNKKDLTVQDIDNHQRQMTHEKELFLASDDSNDKSLGIKEFEVFRHPSINKKTKKIVLDKLLADNDANKDGAIDMHEYIAYLKHQIHEHDEDKNPTWVQAEELRFKNQFPSGKDNLLKGDDILTIQGPTDLTKKAEEEAEHLFKECDHNLDGKLTVDEIIENHNVWLHSRATDYGKHFADEL